MHPNTMLDEIKEILASRFNGVQAAMARAAGLTPSQLNRLINGMAPLSLAMFARLQNATPTLTQKAGQNAANTELHRIRRQRLLEVVEARYSGVIARFAADVDLAQPQAWQITKGDRNIGGRLARKLEKALDLTPGYLDDVRPVADLDSEGLAALRREHLKTIIEVVFTGVQSVCAQHLGFAEAALYQYLSGVKGIGEKAARFIERRVLIEPGSMDRLSEITFPVKALTSNGRGVEIKLALLLSHLQERPVSSRVATLLNASADIALAELMKQPDGPT